MKKNAKMKTKSTGQNEQERYDSEKEGKRKKNAKMKTKSTGQNEQLQEAKQK